MLTRFALLAVVVAALASLSEARRGPGGGGRGKNACGEALKPDRATLKEYKEACRAAGDREAQKKCMAEKQGWVTAAGAFDEAAFRTYIADKIASASTAVQGHVNSRLDDCLTDADMAAFNIKKIMRCLMRDCPAA